LQHLVDELIGNCEDGLYIYIYVSTVFGSCLQMTCPAALSTR
jgi:hypothetical protein